MRAWLGVVAMAIACRTEEPAREVVDERPVVVANAPVDAKVEPVVRPPSEPAAGETTTAFFDPRLLAVWDEGPLSLRRVLAQVDAKQGWEAIAKVFADDVDRITREMAIDWEDDITRTYDVHAAKTELGRGARYRGNGNVARVFQPRWLTSPEARFLLAGVVYRPDRRDFVPGNCGELRLLYRLAYEVQRKGKVSASRMPFTVNVVFTVPDDGAACRDAALSWRAEAVDDAAAPAIAQTLLHGALDLERVRFRQIEINAQVVRFPSDLEHVEGRKLAGQALYWMRIFARKDGTLRPIPLENTPDVQAIRRDPETRRAFVHAIAQRIAQIDEGVFTIPDEFLADVALSWSTLGSARLANKPFSAILKVEEADALVHLAEELDPGTRKFVTHGAALLERLDGASCMGCHQSSSTAGFHVLGFDRPFGSDRDAVALASDGNRLELPFSPHFRAELPRRTAYVDALARGDAPAILRAHPSAPPAEWTGDAPRYAAAGAGMPCPIGELAPASTWSCAEGLTCKAMAEDPGVAFALGQCVPAEATVTAGLPCRASVFGAAAAPARADLLAYNVLAFADGVVREDPIYAIGQGAITTQDYNCRPSKIGVPLGRITRNCRADERALTSDVTREICGIVGGKGFEAMATGFFDSRAFAAGVGRGLLDACSSDRFCREDYICQQLPDFLAGRGVTQAALASVRERGVGFCTPTYFVYQLRLDGHPNPR